MEWTFIDRAQWPAGPWDSEAFDKRVWKDADTDLDCMIHRGPLGSWCGYVGVPSSHSLFGVEFDDAENNERFSINVHGGLTFSEACGTIDDDGSGICHPSDDGDHVWWFGFDCAHYRDLTPGMACYTRMSGEYRTVEFVVEEVKSLAYALNEK